MFKEFVSLQQAEEMSQEAREQLLRAIERTAHDNEVRYWGCSQAVLAALQQHFDLGGNGAVFKAASALAGGVGGAREACGALTGGAMAISLAYGRAKYEPGKVASEQPDYLEAQVRASRLCQRFKEKFGSLRCEDIRVSIRGATFRELPSNTIESFNDSAKCGEVTGPAARLAAEIILQPRELFADEINARLEDLRQIRKLQKASS